MSILPSWEVAGMSQRSERLDWVDVAKGISIILVLVTAMIMTMELWRAAGQTRRANG